MISFTKLGRSRKLFDDFVKELSSKEKDNTILKVYRYDNSWDYVRDQKKRSLESIFVEKEKLNSLIQALDRFRDNEDWYVSHGIPYQFGVLLYGPPGSGKTSIIKAIASYLEYNIHYLSSGDLTSIESAVSSLPDNSVLVIEDIDTNVLTKRREKEDPSCIKPKNSSLISGVMGVCLSEILNAIDGLFSAHGRLMIATTNHIENLDEALIRPGRIDLKIEIGYVNQEILVQFMRSFFPEYRVQKVLDIRPRLTVATLQNMVLQGNTASEIIEFCTQKYTKECVYYEEQVR
jgi:chaperone BCS1